MSTFATGPVSNVAISPDGALVATSGAETGLQIAVLPTLTGDQEHVPVLPTTSRVSVDAEATSSISFPAQGTVYTGSSNGHIARYAVNGTTTSPAREYTIADPHGYGVEVTGVTALSSTSLIVSSGKDSLVRCWDPETRQQVARLSGHKYEVRAVSVASSVSEDGEDVNIVASAGRDKTVRLWDVRAASQGPIKVFQGHNGWVHDVAICGGGPKRPHPIVLSCAGDKTVRMWNLATMSQELVLSGHEFRVWGVAVAADATYAISGSTDTTVRAWDLAEGIQDDQRCHVLNGHRDSVISVSIARDASKSVSSSEDGAILVWNTATLFGREPTKVALEDHTAVSEQLPDETTQTASNATTRATDVVTEESSSANTARGTAPPEESHHTTLVGEASTAATPTTATLVDLSDPIATTDPAPGADVPTPSTEPAIAQEPPTACAPEPQSLLQPDYLTSDPVPPDAASPPVTVAPVSPKDNSSATLEESRQMIETLQQQLRVATELTNATGSPALPASVSVPETAVDTTALGASMPSSAAARIASLAKRLETISRRLDTLID